MSVYVGGIQIGPTGPTGPTASDSTIKHVRKTITFDGSAGSGAVGTITVFTITGRVLIHRVLAFCTAGLFGGASATLRCGGVLDTDGLFDQVIATTVDNNEWWQQANPLRGLVSLDGGHDGGQISSQVQKMTDEDVILSVGTQAIAGGTIIFDVWYEPVTDDGALVAAA